MPSPESMEEAKKIQQANNVYDPYPKDIHGIEIIAKALDVKVNEGYQQAVIDKKMISLETHKMFTNQIYEKAAEVADNMTDGVHVVICSNIAKVIRSLKK